MTTNKIDLRAIKKRTKKAQMAQAQEFIQDLPEKLRKSASQGEDFMFVAKIVSLPSYGKLSFDGNTDHLRGFHRIVWDYLVSEGLHPVLLRAKGLTVPFGGELIGDATYFYMFARWNESNKAESGFLVQELRSLRDAAVAQKVQKLFNDVRGAIDKAVEDGDEWTTVYSFSGLSSPSELLPFDGKKENLTGTAKLIWSYLQANGLNPRLYSVQTPEVWMPGIGRINYGKNGRGYRIAACWYDQLSDDKE